MGCAPAFSTAPATISARPARRRGIERVASLARPGGVDHFRHDSGADAPYDRRAFHLKKDRDMAESELYRKGAALRRQLLGEAFVERSGREVYDDPVMRKFIDLATETVFGALWTRPGLDLKTRALVCVVSDAATGRAPELGLHLRMALRQGWSEDELIEVLLHLSGYVGVPIIRESMLVAKQVFAEMRAEKA
jgi:4-carboxymuconolactone decarboxylase